MVITIAGMIGTGKTSLTQILSDKLKVNAFYEPVEENPVLEQYYADPKHYAFVLQIYFINKRFDMIKQAMLSRNAIVDRSIYEDSLFTRQNFLDGNLHRVEMDTYESLLKNMLSEVSTLPKKSPDLMIYVKNNFDTIRERITKRGRDYEQTTALNDYYKSLLQRYDEFEVGYNASPILTIDGSQYDFVDNQNDQSRVLNIIYDALLEVGSLSQAEHDKLYNSAFDTIEPDTFYIRK